MLGQCFLLALLQSAVITGNYNIKYVPDQQAALIKIPYWFPTTPGLLEHLFSSWGCWQSFRSRRVQTGFWGRESLCPFCSPLWLSCSVAHTEQPTDLFLEASYLFTEMNPEPVGVGRKTETNHLLGNLLTIFYLLPFFFWVWSRGHRHPFPHLHIGVAEHKPGKAEMLLSPGQLITLEVRCLINALKITRGSIT